MKIRNLLIATLLVAGFGMHAQTDLVSSLMSEMNINQKQAEGGAGALLNMAGESMSDKDYSALGDVIPDMGGLLKAVPDLTGGKKSMLGSMASSLTGMPAVVAAFEKLGLKEEHVALMTPLLVDYVEKKGSAMLAKSLGSAIGL